MVIVHTWVAHRRNGATTTRPQVMKLGNIRILLGVQVHPDPAHLIDPCVVVIPSRPQSGPCASGLASYRAHALPRVQGLGFVAAIVCIKVTAVRP